MNATDLKATLRAYIVRLDADESKSAQDAIFREATDRGLLDELAAALRHNHALTQEFIAALQPYWDRDPTLTTGETLRLLRKHRDRDVDDLLRRMIAAGVIVYPLIS
jgi:hypothetical protein